MSTDGAKRPFLIERRRGITQAKPPANNNPGSADLDAVKVAIEDLRLEMREMMAASPPVPAGVDPESYRQQIVEAERLRADLQDLHNAIEETKLEIASLRKRDEDADKLTSASEALRAVVGDTERATDGIINAAEAVEDIAGRLQSTLEGDEALGMVDELYEQVTAVFEHCNFQDITGQRITKVVNTMEYIDDRVQRMMAIWGGDAEFEKIAVQDGGKKPEGEVLHGPAMDGDGSISQADIDALFD